MQLTEVPPLETVPQALRRLNFRPTGGPGNTAVWHAHGSDEYLFVEQRGAAWLVSLGYESTNPLDTFTHWAKRLYRGEADVIAAVEFLLGTDGR